MDRSERHYGRNGRVGLIVPPANPVAEPELHRLVPASFQFYASRMTPQASTDLLTRVGGYQADLRRVAKSFGDMDLDAIVLAFAATSFLVGRGNESDILLTLRAGREIPTVTAAMAVVDAMRALGRRRMALVSPYPPKVNQLAEAYWRDSGMEVADVIALAPPHGLIYELTSQQVFQRARTYRPAGDEAVVLCGTGLASEDQLGPLHAALDVPVVSYNSCLARWIDRLRWDRASVD